MLCWQCNTVNNLKKNFIHEFQFRSGQTSWLPEQTTAIQEEFNAMVSKMASSTNSK
jgi:hypothetical protein